MPGLPVHYQLLELAQTHVHGVSDAIELVRALLASPCSLRDSQKLAPSPQFENINSLALSLLYGPTLTSIYDCWKNHRFDSTDVCWQSDVSAF